MSRSFWPSTITMALSVGVYYLWSVFLQKDDSIGIALGVITSILASAFFTRLKK